MRILVLSHQHSLLPFAHRLKLEDHDVEVVIYSAGNKAKYEKAFAGVIKLTVHNGTSDWQQTIKGLREIAEDGDCVVLTNDPRAAKDFRNAKTLFSTVPSKEAPTGALRMGAWFDGERFVEPHMMMVDEGIYPGGMGASGEGGLTLTWFPSAVFHRQFEVQLQSETERLRSHSFRGLCQWGLDLSPSKEIRLSDGTVTGWPSLHTHAFVSDLVSFGDTLLQGQPDLDQRFVVVLPVTRPPWPYPVMHTPGEHLIEGLTDEQIGQVFWHDASVDQKNRTISTAGLDGLVGVVRGAANTFELAQGRALALAHAMQFPEKQFRPDVGANVRKALAILEEQYGMML